MFLYLCQENKKNIMSKFSLDYQIASKLFVEGLKIKDFTIESAKEVCKNCVGKIPIFEILENRPEEILEILTEIQKRNEN